MPKNQANLGKNPLVTIDKCGAQFEVRGSDRSDVRLDTAEEVEFVTEGNSVFVPNIEGGATLRVPQNTTLRLNNVGANLLVKYLHGDITISEEVGATAVIRHCEQVNIEGTIQAGLHLKYISADSHGGNVQGDATAKYTQGLSFGNITGSFLAGYVEGDLHIGTVNGEANLRYVSGELQIDEVHGSVSARDIGQSINLNQVNGSLTLRTKFNPGTESHMNVLGDAAIRVDNHGVQFIMPAGTEIRVDHDMVVQEDGENLIVNIGEPRATVYMNVGGVFHLSQRSGFDAGHIVVDLDMDDELSEQLADFTSQIDEQMRRLSDNLRGSVADSVRTRIERKLSDARQRIHEAQRRLDDEMEYGNEFRIHIPGVSVHMNTDSDTTKSEPVSDQERLMILQMLQDGKISAEEASNLLATLEG